MQIKLLETIGHMDGGALWASDGQRLFSMEPTPEVLLIAYDEEGYIHFDGRSSPLVGNLDGRLVIVGEHGWRDAHRTDSFLVDGAEVVVRNLRSYDDDNGWTWALCVEEE